MAKREKYGEEDKKMKEKLINNISFKVISLILATLLWIVIINVDDPITSKKFSNIPVSILNEDIIKSQDKVYEVIEGGSVDIFVTARTSVLSEVQASDFKVTADLANLTPPWDSVKIWVTCPKYDTMSSAKLKYNLIKTDVLKVSLEDKVAKQFQVQVIPSGTLQEGYALGSKSSRPNMIQVSGAASQLENVAEVRAVVDVSNQSENIKVKVEPKAYDEKGREIDSSKLEFSSNEITVAIELLETKTVPVVVKERGKAAEGYTVIGIEYEPKKVEIKGSEDGLEKVKTIEIPVNVNGKNSEFEVQKEISDIEASLPEGVQLNEELTAVTIKVIVEKLATKDIIIPVSQIEFENKPENYEVVTLQGITGTLTVQVAGLNENIDSLDFSHIRGHIDVKGLEESTIHTREVEFDLPNQVYLVSAPSLSFTLIDTSQENPNFSPPPSEETTQPPIVIPTIEPTIFPDVTPKPTPRPTETVEPSEETESPTEEPTNLPTSTPLEEESTQEPEEEPEATIEPREEE